MESQTRIYVAGGRTVLGTALIRRLQKDGACLVGAPPDEPALTNRFAVERLFAEDQPQWVIMAGGLSGGIHANENRPADLMLDNLLAGAHVLDAATRHGVEKLLYLGSSCMYPRDAPQPMRAEFLYTGPLEPTNAAYATAKLAGLTLCQAYRQQKGAPFIAGIPANAFGPGDDFDPATSHIIPALMRRMHEAKLRGDGAVDIWGTGTPRREFVFADDLADACLFVMHHYDGKEPINLGCGIDHSVAEIAALIAEIVGYRGELRFDPSRPDGMPRKCLDCTPLFDLGWQPATPLGVALEATYAWFLQQRSRARSKRVELIAAV